MQRAAIRGSAVNLFGRNITSAARSTGIEKSLFLGVSRPEIQDIVQIYKDVY
jgi:hypothetical protein